MLGSNPCNWAIIENRWGGEQDVKPEQVSHRVNILELEKIDPNLHSMPFESTFALELEENHKIHFLRINSFLFILIFLFSL